MSLLSARRPAPDVEGRFQRLVENAQDLVYRVAVKPTWTVEYVGGGVEAITGHTAEEFYADPDLPARAVHPDDAHLILEARQTSKLLVQAVTLRWVHADGHIVWAEHRCVPVYGPGKTLVAIEGIARDVTERVETQERLRESEEQLRRLAARVQDTREEERAMVARELHDELGQTLTALKLELTRAITLLKGTPLTAPAVDRLQALVGLVEIGIATVKRITTSLRPPTLDHLGLPEAVRWEASTFRARTGLRCHVRADTETAPITPEQETVLFRVLQEALTNVARHAKAGAVYITLRQRGRAYEMRIRDNGRGITDAEISDSCALGLLGMRERVALIGGTFDISGSRGKGTVIVVRVALDTQARTMASGGRAAYGRRRNR
jgi:PAS domain S-box-containing protein